MSTPAITVLLALSSPLTRRALRAVLQRAAGIAVVGETDDVTQVVQLAVSLRPDIILCDERLSVDLTVASLIKAQPRESMRPRFVLVAANPSGVRALDSSSFAAILPLSLTESEWSQRLAAAMASESQTAPPPVVGMQDRFTIVGEHTTPERPGSWSTTTLAGAPTRPIEAPGRTGTGQVRPVQTSRPERRKAPLTQEQQTALLHLRPGTGQQVRDATTGLANIHALELALLELPRFNLPAALVVVGLAYPRRQPPSATAVLPILRIVSAMLRANVRQEDLVCYLDQLAFAILMLGVERQTIAKPLRRIRAALREIDMPATSGLESRTALGTGFWEPGLPPEHPVRTGWQAMLRDRDGVS
jgi:DNA-binding NarL/FixJ family response regulator